MPCNRSEWKKALPQALRRFSAAIWLLGATHASAEQTAYGDSGAFAVEIALKSRLTVVEGATRDADGERDGRRSRLGELELEVELDYAPTPQWRAFAEVALAQDLAWHHRSGSAHERLALRLEQAWLAFAPSEGHWRLRLGRQTFEDRFRWLLDDELDALNLQVERGQFELQAAFGQMQAIDGNLLGHDHIEPANHYYLELRQRRAEQHELALYLYARDDLTAERESPLWLGGRAELQPTPWLGLQVNVAALRGHDGDTSLRGYGGDLRVRLAAPEVRGKPRATLGLAFGSGDRDRDDGTDRAFRQSELAGNEASFGGLADVHYYGELLDPELANLRVLTAGVGIDLAPWASLDLVHHRYRQDVASDELRDVGVDVAPSGSSQRLGYETDLVLGLELDEQLEAKIATGWFRPGRAFDDGQDDVWFLDIELDYAF